MRKVLVVGAGKIGGLITTMLAGSGDYQILVGDVDQDILKQLTQDIALPNIQTSTLDVMKPSVLDQYLSANRPDAIISSLPYYCNTGVAEQARKHSLHYFDLTEDVEVTRTVKELSQGSSKAFIPQCGLAPGFISIAAHELMTHFDSVETVKMRVGALPVNPNNALKYSLTWSTDGLINEYGNTCYGIANYEEIPLLPLEGHETIEIDGLLYEAFNTSGGLGTLADTYAGQVRTMNYKTLRYPGHCEKIHFLMNDLRLNEDRDTLKRILEQAIPKTLQDVVLIYAAVSGKRNNELFEDTYVKKIYPQTIGEKPWSAIQVTTAAGICSIVDLIFEAPEMYKGFITQESFPLERILENRFGQYYR